MRVVRVRPGVILGEIDLRDHCGVGELWCSDWVGVVQVYWPFDQDCFEFVTSVNAGGRDGNQLIVVSESVRVRLESSPSWAGGRLLDDGKTICFWWRCLLRQGQYRTVAHPPAWLNGEAPLRFRADHLPATPTAGNAGSAGP